MRATDFNDGWVLVAPSPPLEPAGEAERSPALALRPHVDATSGHHGGRRLAPGVGAHRSHD